MKPTETALRFLCKKEALDKDQKDREATAPKSILTGQRFGPQSVKTIDRLTEQSHRKAKGLRKRNPQPETEK